MINRIEAENAFNLLEGCINRICVTDDIFELAQFSTGAHQDINEIFRFNFDRLTRTSNNRTNMEPNLITAPSTSRRPVDELYAVTKRMFTAKNLTELTDYMYFSGLYLDKICSYNRNRLKESQELEATDF